MALQREIKKRRPFESPHQEAILNILRTNDQYQTQFVRLFRSFGLTPSQYNVLRILRGEGQPLPILEIASRTITVVPGITGLVNRLEESGFVKRERCEEDRRVTYIALTGQAQKVLAAIDEPLEELHRTLIGNLSKAELKTLIGLLEKARESLSEDD